MISQVLALWPVLRELAKGLGWLKDPEQERQAQLEFLRLVAEQDLAASEEFRQFLVATSPQPERVYIWANTWVAITRPAITWVVTGAIVASFFVEGISQRMIATIEAFNNPAGLIVLSIPLWWFIGRDAVKMVAARLGVPVNGTLPTPPSPQPPTPPSRGPAQPNTDEDSRGRRPFGRLD